MLGWINAVRRFVTIHSATKKIDMNKSKLILTLQALKTFEQNMDADSFLIHKIIQISMSGTQHSVKIVQHKQS